MNRRWLCMSVLLGLTTASMAVADDVEDEANRLKGTWAAVEGVRNGKALSKEELARVKISFTGPENKPLLCFRVDLSSVLPSETPNANCVSYVLRPDKSPREIDMTRQHGTRPSNYPGIYELKGDTLKVCANLEPSPDGPPRRTRPTKFAAPAGSDLTLITLKKMKQ